MENLVDLIPREPITCFWEITDACNLRCVHCEADAGTRSKNELDPDEALALVDGLASAGTQGVMLTGGEPLVRADWPAIAARISERGMAPTIITNGLLVDEGRIAQMIDAGVVGLSVSLDGDEEVHDAIRVGPRGRLRGSYRRAIGAIELGAASSLKVGVITQIHRRNIDDLERMCSQIADLGVDVWQVQICMPLGRLLRLEREYMLDTAELPRLTERVARLIQDGRVPIAVADNIGYYDPHEPVLRGSLGGPRAFWTGCKAGLRVVGVCSDGAVKGCPSHPREFVVGNVREESFGAIWNDADRFEYNTGFREELLEGGCAECPYRRLCRAGCTSMAYAVTGTIYDNPFCVQRAVKRDGGGPDER
ncbi:MAG: radical SAM protein [Deltaproteobacteria bacterium]|nr:radical SAM protein [Deltaproteobacteria bacterium]